MMNHPPKCIFEVNELGNKEFSWSGLTTVSMFVHSYACNCA